MVEGCNFNAPLQGVKYKCLPSFRSSVRRRGHAMGRESPPRALGSVLQWMNDPYGRLLNLNTGVHKTNRLLKKATSP